jgi:hypothetical protein
MKKIAVVVGLLIGSVSFAGPSGGGGSSGPRGLFSASEPKNEIIGIENGSVSVQASHLSRGSVVSLPQEKITLKFIKWKCESKDVNAYVAFTDKNEYVLLVFQTARAPIVKKVRFTDPAGEMTYAGENFSLGINPVLGGYEAKLYGSADLLPGGVQSFNKESVVSDPK